MYYGWWRVNEKPLLYGLFVFPGKEQDAREWGSQVSKTFCQARGAILKPNRRATNFDRVARVPDRYLLFLETN